MILGKATLLVPRTNSESRERVGLLHIEKMRIVLIKSVGKRWEDEQYYIDIGQGFLGTALKKAGHEVRILDCMREKLSWKKFDTARSRKEFSDKLGKRIDHSERIAGFKSGLDWLVSDGGKITPLKQVISRDKIELLEGVVSSTQGYYVYYKS